MVQTTNTFSISGKWRFHPDFFFWTSWRFFVKVSCEVYRWKNPCSRNVELKLSFIYLRSVEVGCVQFGALTNMQNLHSWLPHLLFRSWITYYNLNMTAELPFWNRKCEVNWSTHSTSGSLEQTANFTRGYNWGSGLRQCKTSPTGSGSKSISPPTKQVPSSNQTCK